VLIENLTRNKYEGSRRSGMVATRVVLFRVIWKNRSASDAALQAWNFLQEADDLIGAQQDRQLARLPRIGDPLRNEQDVQASAASRWVQLGPDSAWRPGD
jgi:hypothetical protein